MLVCPTRAADTSKLPYEEYRRPARVYDALMDGERRAVRRVCHSAELQYSVDSAAAMLLLSLRRELGPVPDIWTVSGTSTFARGAHRECTWMEIHD